MTRFDPPEALSRSANLTPEMAAEAARDRLGFWARQASRLHWDVPFQETLDWSDAPFARWFVGGRLNVAYNCVDRHVEAGLGDRVALHFVGEPGDERAITYRDLKEQVCRAAGALEQLGVTAGDPVAIYLPMIPEAIVAMLACARIGAPHTVVFGGFSADALADRITDFGARVVVTADGGYRRGAAALKSAVDEALTRCPDVHAVLVVRRTGQPVDWVSGRDVRWDDALSAASSAHTPQPFDSEHPLFVMYTSGTTGKPKGILHTTAGYLVQAAFTFWAVFDHKPDDVYWCTADIGWITGHSYVAYGPLAVGATQVLYEGTPDTPHRGRWWEIVERHRVSLLYTAPTAIRTFMKWGEGHPAGHDLSSLRVLGTVGESINPEAYHWYRHHIGQDRTPIVDTWWQTETGGHMISPLPGITAAKPGAAMTPLPGICADVVDDDGKPVAAGQSGYLVLTEPWPAMARTIWNDPDRFRQTYWSRWPGHYFAGDGARRDEDGDIWLLGRVDDVMNVSGHRLSTVEIESALLTHPRVAEAAVVGASHETTGQTVVAYVVTREDGAGADQTALTEELRGHVGTEIGPIAKPSRILIVAELPKTRSGKIMRRLLRDVAENRVGADATTLADSSVMDHIRAGMATALTQEK